MQIPNGLTLEVKNRLRVTRALGNMVLNPKEQEFVHFTTTKQLREALRLNKVRDIALLGEIPEEVIALLEMKEDELADDKDGLNKSGVIYRDEFMQYQEQTAFAKMRVVAEDPPDAKVGWMWMVDPNATSPEGGTE